MSKSRTGLLPTLQQELGMSMIFVTHYIGVAAQIADKVAVMYAGRVVEYGAVEDGLLRPSHPYTLGMLSSTVSGHRRGHEIEAIPGNPPDLRHPIQGCSFAPRCKFAVEACLAEAPPPTFAGSGRYACCIRAGELGPASQRAFA